MAVSIAATLLDELMGRNRNDGPTARKKSVRWEDPEFCKFFLVKFCPHDLFVNTRANLGVCTKVHCDKAKAQFNKASIRSKMHYEDKFVAFSTRIFDAIKRRIKISKQELKLTSKTKSQKIQVPFKRSEEYINELVQTSGQLVSCGQIEEAQILVKRSDRLKERLDVYELTAVQEQIKMCEVCGVILVDEYRTQNHLMGKQHMGNVILKNAVNEILDQRKKYFEELKKQRCDEKKIRVDRTRSNSINADRQSRDYDRDTKLKGSRNRLHFINHNKIKVHERERRRSRIHESRNVHGLRHRGHNVNNYRDNH